MDPISSVLDSLDQVTPPEQVIQQRTPDAPPELVVPERTTSAPFELVAPERTTSAPSELVVPERTMSAFAGNGASDKVVIEVDGDDSQLSSASPEVVRLPRWDDLGRSYLLNSNFSFKGTVTKPRSSSSSSSARVVIPYQRGRAYHSTHGDRRDFTAARA
jgi:hypothetical protein